MRRLEPVARPTLPLGAAALREDSHATDVFRRGRVLRAVSLAAVLALVTTGVALADAGGQGTVTITQQYRDTLLFSQPTTNPCTGASGTITGTAHTGFEHITYFTTGPEFWFTSTAEGTATFTPDDPNGVSASGHFAEWFGESFNNKNDVQSNTSTFRLKGSDGSHIVLHEVIHVSTNANGVIIVSFDNVGLHCG